MSPRHPLMLIVSSLLFATTGCQSGPPRGVHRVNPAMVMDLQGGFDEDDARAISTALVIDAMSHPWLERWNARHRDRPVVIVGELLNNTSDYIDPRLITKSLERALVRSGEAAVVASSAERQQVREERRQGQDWSRIETVKRMAHELGADLICIGWIGEDIEISPDRSRRIRYYQISLELVDVESNEKVWIGTHEIEKRVRL